MFQIKKL